MITKQEKRPLITVNDVPRKAETIQHEVDAMRVKLSGTKSFWSTLIKKTIDLELIPHLYQYNENKAIERYDMEVVSTNGSCVIHAHVSKDSIVLTKAYRLKKRMSKEEAAEKGYDWYSPTLALWMDKNFHFLKRYGQRKFDLNLIVPAYFKAKGMMPNDRVITSDGDSKVVLAKKDSQTIILVTGMKVADIDWDEYLDKKFY